MFKLLKFTLCIGLLMVLLALADFYNFNQLLPSKEQVTEYFQENYSAIKTFSGQVLDNLNLSDWLLASPETQLADGNG